MTDWLLPTEDDLYLGATGVLQLLKDRDFDAGSLFLNAPTNPIVGLMRYLRASNKFQEYDGAAWVDKILSLTGGGTGAATAADARTNLGLGTIVTQNANNVNITGGNLAGSGAGITNLNADNLASGTLPAARFPASLPAISGVNLTVLSSGALTGALPALNAAALTNLNGAAISSGIVAADRLGTGGAAGKFLRYDNTWADAMAYRAIMQIDDTTHIPWANGEYTVPLVGFTNNGKMFFIPAMSMSQQNSAGTVSWSMMVRGFPATNDMRVVVSNVAGGAGSLRLVGVVLEIM